MEEKELVNYLLYLIANNNLSQFYHLKVFKDVKAKVFKDLHYECQECLKENKLTVVFLSDPLHHVKEIKEFPSLALSEYYNDELGNLQRNLLPLCYECHNKVHNRFQKNEEFINEERW